MSKIEKKILDLLDFNHYLPIITDENNWEQIFSETFSVKEKLKNNVDNLINFKTKLEEKAVTFEDLQEYPLYIYSISNCFTKSFNIFLSYSTKDSKHFNIPEIAKKLEEYSEIGKVLYWEKESGSDVVQYMKKALEISQIFILFCSNNADRSKAVEGEWSAAYQLMKDDLMKIIPVYEDKKFIPNLLLPLILVKHTKENFDQFIENLYSEIIRKN